MPWPYTAATLLRLQLGYMQCCAWYMPRRGCCTPWYTCCMLQFVGNGSTYVGANNSLLPLLPGRSIGRDPWTPRRCSHLFAAAVLSLAVLSLAVLFLAVLPLSVLPLAMLPLADERVASEM